MIQSLWKIFGQFLKILNIYLPNDPAIPLLTVHPSEMDKKKHTTMINTLKSLKAKNVNMKDQRENISRDMETVRTNNKTQKKKKNLPRTYQ